MPYNVISYMQDIYTVFPRMSPPALIISTFDVPGARLKPDAQT